MNLSKFVWIHLNSDDDSWTWVMTLSWSLELIGLHCPFHTSGMLWSLWITNLLARSRGAWGATPVILLMEEIQHHLGCVNPYNGIFTISTGLPNFFHQQYEARWLDMGNVKPWRTFFGCSRLAQRVEIIHMSLEPGIRCNSELEELYMWRNIDVWD